MKSVQDCLRSCTAKYNGTPIIHTRFLVNWTTEMTASSNFLFLQVIIYTQSQRYELLWITPGPQ